MILNALSCLSHWSVVHSGMISNLKPMLYIDILALFTSLNLTAANHVILMDIWWNPAVEGMHGFSDESSMEAHMDWFDNRASHWPSSQNRPTSSCPRCATRDGSYNRAKDYPASREKGKFSQAVVARIEWLNNLFLGTNGTRSTWWWCDQEYQAYNERNPDTLWFVNQQFGSLLL